ncbi:MAG: ABC transporter permease subunit [Abitibacteriaceae bacterium]|nr:ABC transporter permease subunit [Abditibacteriaceae bacterium]
MELNPILQREVRARWRRLPAFATVFGYAALFSVLMGAVYAQYAKTFHFDPQQNSAALGHELFVTLTWMQTLGWMLLAPLLTVTSITAEREAGLLEALQLSPLTPLRIVTGKLLSALSFMALMLLVPLPAIAVCFQLGGVSPYEFMQALLLHITTAVTGAIIGLNCSAWSRRTATALGAVAASLLVLNLACLYLGPILWYAHPIVATLAIFNPEFGFASWAESMLVQVTLSCFLVYNAAGALLRPLNENSPPPILMDAAGSQLAPAPTHEENQVNLLAAGTSPSSEITIEGTDHFPFVRWWQVPLPAHWRFANPILQRELRHKFRFRQESAYGQFDLAPVSFIVITCFFLLVEAFCFMGVLLQPDVRANLWWLHAYGWLFIVIAASALMGASAFAREREAGLLEPLLLSSLSPREILWGKLCAPLLACCYYSLPVLLAMVLCIDIIPAFMTGISPLQAIATLLIVGAAAWCYTALGLCLSWCCKRLSIALTWTLVGLFTSLLCAPLLLNAFGDSSWWQPGHPFLALAAVSHRRDAFSIAATTLPCALILFGVGCILLLWLAWAMRYGAREKDRKRQ